MLVGSKSSTWVTCGVTSGAAGLIGTPMWVRSGIEPASSLSPGTEPLSTSSGFFSRS